MPRIPREVVDAVRERTDLVEVVQRHVALSRRGSSWVGLCPFHQEKTPSFNVVPSKGIYHCFGCNSGGDVFSFVMKLEGLSFFEAVSELGNAVGIEVETRELSPAEKRELKKRATLYDALEAAAQFYEAQLWTSSEGQVARDYLEKRDIKPEILKEARVGWAPSGWTRLIDALHNQGLSPALAIEAGLAKESRREGGNAYDAFRERVVFPIRDDRGRVIGFGGRILEGDGPKYLNSPETRLYQKSRVLYGLYEGRNAIQRADRAIVVEGYFDVLALRQAGFGEAVANCGTAITQQHFERIRTMTRNVILLLDADEAGSRAAEKALPMAIETGMHPFRLQLPGAKDPDELIREEGPEAMAQAMEHREPLVEWVVQRKLSAAATAGGAIGAMSREAVVEELLPVLARLPDTAVSRLAGRLGVHEASLRRRLAAVQRAPAQGAAEAEPAPQPTGWKPDREAVHLLWLLVHRRDQVSDLVRAMDPALLLARYPAELAEVVARLLAGEPEAGILPELADPGVRRTLQAVVAREKLYDEDEAALGCCQILLRITEVGRDQALRQANRALTQALAANDPAARRAAQDAKAALLASKTALETAIASRDPAAVVRMLRGPSGSADPS